MAASEDLSFDLISASAARKLCDLEGKIKEHPELCKLIRDLDTIIRRISTRGFFDMGLTVAGIWSDGRLFGTSDLNIMKHYIKNNNGEWYKHIYLTLLFSYFSARGYIVDIKQWNDYKNVVIISWYGPATTSKCE